MSTTVDPLHFQELAEQNPAGVCQRVGCAYDAQAGCYHLMVWGIPHRIYPEPGRIVCDSSVRLHPYMDLFMVHYLLTSKKLEPLGQWISEKDLPEGPTFFRGPHEIPTGMFTRRFQNNIDAFNIACAHLQGTRLNMADAAWIFTITPRIPVAVLYWVGDEDFPPEAKILYDKTISEHFASDIIFALAVGICHRLKKSIIPEENSK